MEANIEPRRAQRQVAERRPRLISAEWLKFCRLASLYIAPLVALPLLAIFVTSIGAGLEMTGTENAGWGFLDMAVSVSRLIGLIMVIPAGSLIAREYTGPGQLTFTITPQRWRPLAAKVLLASIATVVVTVVYTAAANIVMLRWAGDATVWKFIMSLLRASIGALFLLLLGMGLVVIMRSMVWATITMFSVVLLLNFFVSMVAPTAWVPYLLPYSPSGVFTYLASGSDAELFWLAIDHITWHKNVYLLVLAAVLWLAAVWIPAYFINEKRDIP